MYRALGGIQAYNFGKFELKAHNVAHVRPRSKNRAKKYT